MKNKVVAITGAGSGIGRATARQLAALGAKLAISDVNADALEQTRTLCENAGAEVVAARMSAAEASASVDVFMPP